MSSPSGDSCASRDITPETKRKDTVMIQITEYTYMLYCSVLRRGKSMSNNIFELLMNKTIREIT